MDVPHPHAPSCPQGAVPFFVSATSGTTVLGAFDPLGPVADVCQRHGLWLHVDVSAGGALLCTPSPDSPHPPRSAPQAAWGGSALLSRKHRHLLAGIERYHRRGAGRVLWGHRTTSRGAPQPFSPCRADSVAWNPHKMLTVGLQCSAFLLRDDSVSPTAAGIPSGLPSDPLGLLRTPLGTPWHLL